MSKFEHKENNGSLFRAKEKKTDKSPDYNGTALIDGVEYQIAGWKKEMKTGGNFLSLKFNVKDQKKEEFEKKAEAVFNESAKDEDLPF